MRKRVSIVLAGQVPPPLHGQALAIERLVASSFNSLTIHHARMSFSDTVGQIGRFHVRKLLHTVVVVMRILWLRIRTRSSVLYYPPAGPQILPVLRDTAILLAVRPFFKTTVLDYHAGGTEAVEKKLPKLVRPLFRKAFYNADLAIDKYVPSQGRVPIPAKTRAIVPYGIEDVAGDVIPRADPADTLLKVLFVGLLVPTKGILTIVEAMRHLNSRRVPVRMSFIGEFDSPSTESEFWQAVAEAGVGDSIEVHGRQTGSRKWERFRSADVFCYPSYYANEALPIAIIEALQFSLPVVASDWRGIPSLVVDGETGFIIPTRDPMVLAGKIEWFHRNPERRSEMGRNARAAFLRRHTIGMYLDSMEKLLSSCGRAVLQTTRAAPRTNA